MYTRQIVSNDGLQITMSTKYKTFHFPTRFLFSYIVRTRTFLEQRKHIFQNKYESWLYEASKH